MKNFAKYVKILSEIFHLIDIMLFNSNSKSNLFISIFQIRGQDFLVDLCTTLDLLEPLVQFMTATQSVNLPPWKVPVWFPKVIAHLKESSKRLDDIAKGEKPDAFYFPRLSENWVDINTEENGEFKGVSLLEGWLVTDAVTVENADGKKEPIPKPIPGRKGL